MPDVNFEWVSQQMAEAKVKVGSGKAVMRLLETWSSIPDISPKLAQEAIAVFSKLALGTIITSDNENVDEVWVPVQPGQVKVADEVRVLADAFSDSTGVLHNGRRGVVTAVRYGDVIFKSTDGKKPQLDGVHYSPYKLEKRVK